MLAWMGFRLIEAHGDAEKNFGLGPLGSGVGKWVGGFTRGGGGWGNLQYFYFKGWKDDI